MENVVRQEDSNGPLNFNENRVLARQLAEKLAQEIEPKNAWFSGAPRLRND